MLRVFFAPKQSSGSRQAIGVRVYSIPAFPLSLVYKGGIRYLIA